MRRSATVAFADQSRLDGRLCAAKTTECPKPEPRGAVKPRERERATRVSGLGLCGEHGSGGRSAERARRGGRLTRIGWRRLRWRVRICRIMRSGSKYAIWQRRLRHRNAVLLNRWMPEGERGGMTRCITTKTIWLAALAPLVLATSARSENEDKSGAMTCNELARSYYLSYFPRWCDREYGLVGVQRRFDVECAPGGPTHYAKFIGHPCIEFIGGTSF